MGVHLTETLEPLRIELLAAVAVLLPERIPFALRVEVVLGLPLLQQVQGWLRQVHVPGVDQLRHVPEEVREEQGPDVRPIDVGVRHQHDAVVSRLLKLELVADPGPDRGDQSLDLEVLEDLVESGLLDVEDLPADRQDRLRGRVARLLGAPPSRVPLHDVELAGGRIAQLAIGEFAGERAALEEGLAAGEVARLLRRHPRLGCLLALLDDPPRFRGMFLEPLGELGVDRGLDERAHGRVAELGLGLSFELRFSQLHRQDRDEALTHVLADHVLFLLLEEPLGTGIPIQHVRE